MSLNLRKDINRPLTYKEMDDNFIYLESISGGTSSGPTFSGDYNDLMNKPEFKTINNENIIGSGDISINGGDIIIERSLDDLKTDISNNELVPGALYEITGVHRAHQVNGVNIPALYDDGRDLGTTIFLKAISESELETLGSGVFYNPRYDKQVQGYGIWSNIVDVTLSNIVGDFMFYDETVTADNGAVGRILTKGWIRYISGDWSSATSITGDFLGATADIDSVVTPSYDVDDVVIWGGYAWKNLNGNIGSANDDLSLNGEWEKLDYDNDSYYNRVIDVIEYDIEHDVITRRRDVRNEIDVTCTFNDIRIFSTTPSVRGINSISLMQWGNGLDFNVGIGRVSAKHQSLATLVNFRGRGVYNVNFDNDSRMSNVNFDNGGAMSNVNFDNDSRMSNVNFDNDSRMSNVNFDNGGAMSNVNFDNGGTMYNVNFDNGGTMYNVNFDNDSRMSNVNFDNGGTMYNVNFDNYGAMYNVNFDNDSRMYNVNFDNYGGMSNVNFDISEANFQNTIYSGKNFRDINFKGNSFTTQNIPDLNMATTIFDIVNCLHKEVFDAGGGVLKIRYWDVLAGDFAIVDITN